ncbi:MAG: cupin [Desulfuromonadales bacterium GWD2_61_12]|nr:MAG: cupin [Desulfuromonadales bacterium GWD2_61_12]HBT83037.1 cupin [Desulfuromonas sp.]
MNLLADLPAARSAEETTLLQQGTQVRIERIVSHGQSSPPGFWYDQPDHEWVLVLKGHGVIEFADGRTVTLAAGDTLAIPAGTRHRVAATATDRPTVWLAVFHR